MIMLWGLPEDQPLAAVLASLRERDAEVTFVDQHRILETEVEVSVEGTFSGSVGLPGRKIDLTTVGAVYLRPYDARRLPSVSKALCGQGNPSPALAHALAVEQALLSWCEVAEALIINRPSAMASNSSKPYQARLIAAQGFAVPDTLITTDPQAAREFWEYHGKVIYKSVSGVRSIVTTMSNEQSARLADVRWCPTQFQEFIAGEDYRVHVVGEKIYACRIISGAADYRYARSQGADLQIAPCQLPEDIAGASRQLARSLELVVAGVDLRRTAEGRWFCFEVNPSPGFTFYQEFTKDPIDQAIADLLLAGACGEV
jgi:hypothetical protein